MKKVLIYIINFFLVLCIFMTSSLIVFSNTILSKKYAIKTLEKSNYYEKIYKDIEDGFKNYVMQSGLEEDIVEGLCNMEKVHDDINKVIDVIYENKEINIDVQSIQEELKTRINSELEQKNKKINSQEKEWIQTFENNIINEYKDSITYSEKAIKEIANGFEKINSIIIKVEIIFAVISIGLLAIIISINKNIKETLKTLAITEITIGIMDIILKILLGMRIHNVLILSATFSESIIYLINCTLSVFLIMGIVRISTGIMVVILTEIKEK